MFSYNSTILSSSCWGGLCLLSYPFRVLSISSSSILSRCPSEFGRDFLDTILVHSRPCRAGTCIPTFPDAPCQVVFRLYSMSSDAMPDCHGIFPDGKILWQAYGQFYISALPIHCEKSQQAPTRSSTAVRFRSISCLYTMDRTSFV